MAVIFYLFAHFQQSICQMASFQWMTNLRRLQDTNPLVMMYVNPQPLPHGVNFLLFYVVVGRYIISAASMDSNQGDVRVVGCGWKGRQS